MLRVRDIMTRDVIRLTPEATIREAMELLSTRHLGGAPVIVEEKVIGVISMTDILGFIVAAPEPELADQEDTSYESMDVVDTGTDDDESDAASMSEEVWDAWMRGSGSRVDDAIPQGNRLLDQRTVGDVMTDQVFSVPPGASVRSAATMMRDRGIHRVLVMDGKTLVGIVSAMDIARAVSEKRTAGDDGIGLSVCRGDPPIWFTS